MRLLYLSPTASMGGAERVLLDLLTNVRRVQPTWTIGLFVANDGPLVEDARRIGVKVRVLPFPREFARGMAKARPNRSLFDSAARAQYHQ